MTTNTIDRTVAVRPPRPLRPREMREGRMAALLLSPTFSVLALVIAYPLLSALYQSLFGSNAGLDADGFVVEGETFVGLGNYVDIFVGSGAARFYNALGNTTFFTFTTVALEVVIGVILERPPAASFGSAKALGPGPANGPRRPEDRSSAEVDEGGLDAGVTNDDAPRADAAAEAATAAAAASPRTTSRRRS